MKLMKRVEGKWVAEHPPDLLNWLYENDGGEAVAIDGSNYYCSLPEMADTYQAAWAKDNKEDDPRRALTFYDLGAKLQEGEVTPDHTKSPLWCDKKQVLCSERVECEKGAIKCLTDNRVESSL